MVVKKKKIPFFLSDDAFYALTFLREYWAKEDLTECSNLITKKTYILLTNHFLRFDIRYTH